MNLGLFVFFTSAEHIQQNEYDLFVLKNIFYLEDFI